MLKVRGWIGVVSAPILLASVGCSIGPRSYAAHGRGLPPERLMSMARTLERQGHLAQAKAAYMQVLAVQPNYPNAKENLDTLIAAEMGRGSRATGNLSLPTSANLPQAIARNQTLPASKNSTVNRSAVRIPAALTETASANRIIDSEKIAPTSQPALTNHTPTDTANVGIVAADQAVIVEVGSVDKRESIEFFPPVEQASLGDGIEQFFGPFQLEMVQYLIANREQYQPKIVELVSNENVDWESRTRAVFLLGAVGPAAADSIPVLHREMSSTTDACFKVDLAEAILKIHSEDQEAISVLIGSLNDPDRNVKQIAVFALRNAVSPRTLYVIDALAESLDTDDLKLRRMIFLTLAEFGPAAERVIPEVVAALNSPDPATREVAKAALASIAPDRNTTMIRKKPARWELVLGE